MMIALFSPTGIITGLGNWDLRLTSGRKYASLSILAFIKKMAVNSPGTNIPEKYSC